MKYIFVVMTLLVTMLSSAANEDTKLMTIGEHEISVEEFQYLYKKNNQVSTSDTSTLDDYVDLFVNFKLKVIEAEDLGLDTMPTFVKELKGYEEQLAQPYLKDQDLDEKLIREAYERLKEEVEASHILINMKSDAPADTLIAYKKAMEIRQKVLDGADFATTAKEYSNDPSAQTNGGYLGFFSGFQMVLPFEEAAFNTPVGEVSMPTKSQFGYHIIQVKSRRPSSGERNLSHILILSNEKMDEEEQNKKKEVAFQLYEEIKNGKDFGELAKQSSEDRGSAKKNGNLGFIKRGQTIAPFEEAAFALAQSGDITPPVQTRFGWHIIRLESKKGVPSYEEKKADIKRRLSKDERGDKPEEVFLAKLKKEYNFTTNTTNLEALYSKVKGHEIDSLSQVYLLKMDAEIMSFGDKKFTQADLSEYCYSKKVNGTDFEASFKDFEKENLINFEKTQLSRKYPDYRNLIKEYHDGLLLFEISNKRVWGKASEDEEGLTKFHKKHKKDYRFRQAQYKGNLIYLKDSTSLLAYNELKASLTNEAISDSLSKEEIRFESSFYKKGDNKYVDAHVFGKSLEQTDDAYDIVLVDGEMYDEGDIKPLEATRGACISDYQDYLEARWIKDLRKSYKITIDKNLLAELK